MPLISIIIPVYNQQNCIETTIKRTLQQTVKDIEIICIDDGSNDESRTILNNLSKWDDRIRVFHKKNAGAGLARNTGIKEATGEYLFFLDADDYIFNNTVLENLYFKAKNNNANICGGNLLYKIDDRIEIEYQTVLSEEKLVKFEDYQIDYFFTRFIYKRDFIIDNKIFFPSLRIYEDPIFFTKFMTLAKSFYYIPINVYVYEKKHQNTIARNEQQTIDYIIGLTESLNIAARNNYKKLYTNSYKQLITAVCVDVEKNLPSKNEVLFKTLIIAENSIDRDFLIQCGVTTNNSEFNIPILSLIWKTSNNYIKLRNNRILSFLIKIKKILFKK